MNNNNNKRHKFLIWIFLPTILAILIQYALSMMLIEFFVVDGFANYSGGGFVNLFSEVIERFVDYADWIELAYAIVAGIIAICIYRNVFAEDGRVPLQECSDNKAFTIGGIVLFSLGMQYVSTYLINAVSAVFPSWLEEYEELMEAAGLDSETITIVMFLYAVVFAPICEELLFRGITFSAAKKLMSPYAAILVQAIMFGAFHMNKLQGTYAFVLALGMGYIMYLYDNLLITIVIHMLFNLIGTVGANYLPSGVDTLISFFVWSLGSLIVTYVSILLLKKGAKGRDV